MIPFVRTSDAGDGLGPQNLRQRQAAQGQSADLQKRSPRNSIAKTILRLAEDRQHGTSLLQEHSSASGAHILARSYPLDLCTHNSQPRKCGLGSQQEAGQIGGRGWIVSGIGQASNIIVNLGGRGARSGNLTGQAGFDSALWAINAACRRRP